jgi:hypothetical protein
VESSSRNLELEAAAFANLDDLDSWRVFADWLLSKGDVRGELANLAAHLDGAFLSERKNMTARMRELERPFVDAWHEWAQEHDLLGVEAKFKRGFAYSLQGSLTQMRPVIDELFERDPIQRLTLTDVDSDTLTHLLERRPPWLARLRYLKLQGQLDATAISALAAIELPQLHRLNLLGTGIEEDICKQLARLQTRALEHLTLTANEIDHAAVAALLRSPTRGQWRELYLSGNPIDSEAVALLAADKTLALTALYMREIEANLDAFLPFADRAAIPTLTSLELHVYGYWQYQAVLDQLRARFGAGLILK